MLYPAKDLIFYNADIHGNLIAKQRINVIKAILEDKGVTVILTIDGLMDYLVPLGAVKNSIIKIDSESTVDINKLKDQLIGLGYEKKNAFHKQSTRKQLKDIVFYNYYNVR